MWTVIAAGSAIWFICRIAFNVITKTDGDVYARLQVRMGEVAESITLIRKALKLLQQDDSQLHCGELAYKTLTGSWGSANQHVAVICIG